MCSGIINCSRLLQFWIKIIQLVFGAVWILHQNKLHFQVFVLVIFLMSNFLSYPVLLFNTYFFFVSYSCSLYVFFTPASCRFFHLYYLKKINLAHWGTDWEGRSDAPVVMVLGDRKLLKILLHRAGSNILLIRVFW